MTGLPSIDVTLKEFFKNNDVYASIFNDFLFKREFIKAEELEEINTSQQENVKASDDIKKVYRYRDCLRRTSYANFIILGIEDQSYIHYAMPIRDMLYDALSYTAELTKYAVDMTEWNVDEKLSKVPKGAKVTPVITVVFYTGESKWDGPTSLYDMLDTDIFLKSFVPDYPLYILDIGHHPDVTFSNENLEELKVFLGSIYDGTADQSEYEVKNSTVSLAGILANDKKLYTLANESKGGKRQMCEVLRLRDERIIREKDEEYKKILAEKDAESQALLAEKDAESQSLLAKKDAESQALLAKKDAESQALLAEIESLKEQLRLAQAQ